jgi:hypothetical protein
MEKSVYYVAVFFEEKKLMDMFKPVHENLFYHHSTIDSEDITDQLDIGKKVKIRIVGRLTTKKVDVLLVQNQYSKRKYPHITLSTAKGVKPAESNTEIENNLDKIKYIKTKGLFIWGHIGYFGDNGVIIKENKLLIDKIILEELTNILNRKNLKEYMRNRNVEIKRDSNFLDVLEYSIGNDDKNIDFYKNFVITYVNKFNITEPPKLIERIENFLKILYMQSIYI